MQRRKLYWAKYSTGACIWLSSFFLNPFVRRVNRRTDRRT